MNFRFTVHEHGTAHQQLFLIWRCISIRVVDPRSSWSERVPAPCTPRLQLFVCVLPMRSRAVNFLFYCLSVCFYFLFIPVQVFKSVVKVALRAILDSSSRWRFAYIYLKPPLSSDPTHSQSASSTSFTKIHLSLFYSETFGRVCVKDFSNISVCSTPWANSRISRPFQRSEVLIQQEELIIYNTTYIFVAYVKNALLQKNKIFLLFVW